MYECGVSDISFVEWQNALHSLRFEYIIIENERFTHVEKLVV